MVPRWIRSPSPSSRPCPSPRPFPPHRHRHRHHHHHHQQEAQTCHGNQGTASRVFCPPCSGTAGSCKKSHIHDLSVTRLAFARLTHHGIHLDRVTCESLLLSFAKCGAVEDALYLLHHGLQQASAFAWTAIISSYADHGKPLEALENFRYMMSRDGIEPDRYTFVALLKACGNIPFLDEGRNLHMYVEKKGCASDPFIACSLVNMYGRCKSIDEAEMVFVQMRRRDVASWTAMVSAFLQEGKGARAIRLYRQICAEDRGACEQLLVLAIKACGCLVEEMKSGEYVDDEMVSPCSATKAMVILKIGWALHSRARMGSNLIFHHNVLCSALISMYGKCGSISHAENAFLQLPRHDDIITWNSMLSAYVDHGLGKKALWLYKLMHDEAMLVIGKQTIAIALRACLHLPAEMEPDQLLDLVHAFYEDVEKQNLVSEVSVGGAFLSLFGKCARIDDAERIFSGLSAHDILSWTKMLSAYLENGHPDKALQTYARLERYDKSCVDQHAVAIAIQACSMFLDLEDSIFLGKNRILEIGHALHAKARRRCFASNVFISSSLITMYGKCGRIAEAENLFCAASVTQSVVLWTAMLSVCLDNHQRCTVLRFYYEMQMEGISPDKHVFMVAVQACAKIGEEGVVAVGRLSKSVALQIGKGLHADADRMGFSSDVLVASTLLNMYGKCGELTEAEMLFETMSQPNEVTSFTAMISVYVEQGRGDKALQLFADRSKDIFLDDVIVICILKACTLTGSLEVCWQVHSGIVSTGLCQSKSVTNTILHAYGCCASMADAIVAMDELTQPDIVSWNSCIGSDGRNTMMNLLMFESMLLAGIEPEEITFLSVLSSLNHLGLVEKGIECFKSMPEKYGLIPNKKHYVAFVDLLGRAGNLAQLKDIISSHGPTDRDVFCWIRLLSACDRHGDVELGEYIFDHVMHLQPDEVAAYVLMSNIYAYRTE